MAIVYLSLGSNFGDRIGYVQQATSLLGETEGITIVRTSAFYETEPWAMNTKNWFVNAVLEIKTTHSPQKLLELCQRIEKQLGRNHTSSNGYTDRTIDIDILFYNKDIISFNNRYLPLYNNAFVYFDPPYYIKGKQLYTNFLQPEDHFRIHDSIMNVTKPWLLTYDNVEQIADIYNDSSAYEFNLSYTVNSLVNRKGTELMYASDGLLLDKIPDTVKQKINLRRRLTP